MAEECRTHKKDANFTVSCSETLKARLGFVVDTVALGQAFLTIYWFSSVNIIPPT